MGRIDGASHVYLRTGPGVSHPPLAVLRYGKQVEVEKSEGDWYHVSLPNGKRGYIYKPLIHMDSRNEILISVLPLVAEVEKAPNDLPSAAIDHEIETEPLPLLPSAQPSFPVHAAHIAVLIPPHKIQHGWARDFGQWAGFILCTFILGWIFGGNYYLRRHRIERTKLRL